jgi:hypothetical protein
MTGLEPPTRAARSVIVRRTSALDARVEPAHDETYLGKG